MGSRNVDELLTRRYVLFSCEGTAEQVIIEKLVGGGLLKTPREHVVDDPLFFTPYTRLRKANDIAERFFTWSYEGATASGLLVARIVDSRAAKFSLPRRWQGFCEVESFFTRPEIEMLVIHAEGAYNDWLRAKRKDRQLRASEFCKGELRLQKIKESGFLSGYWDIDKLVNAIKQYDEHRPGGDAELSLGALIK